MIILYKQYYFSYVLWRFIRYEDNSYLEGDFERLAIQKLIQDIKESEINCVIVKKIIY